MKRLIQLAILTLVGTAFAQAPVKYEISFPNAAHHEAEVKVAFSDLPTGTLELRMSRTSPGRYALHEFAKNVYSVTAVDSRGRELEIARYDPHQWNVIGHDGTVRVSYTIFGDRSDGTYLAIDNTHAHLNIPATFVWARGLEARPIEIQFNPPEADWQIATQLVPTGTTNKFTAPNLAYFLDSPTEISAFDLREWKVPTREGEATLRMAIHHDGDEALVDAFTNMSKSVVAEEIAMFQEAPRFDYGTYTFIADYLPYVNGDGMEHRNSTILSSTRSLDKNATRNIGTVIHEFFHAWNVERMRPRTLEPFNFEAANMSGELWFAEGFTNYYTALIARRSGLTSLDSYARRISGAINTVTNSPGRKFFSAVEMSMKAPFVDAGVSNDPKNLRNTFISYYTFGEAIGLGLDLTLRTRFENITLDDFMRAVWAKHGRTEMPYTNDDLEQILGAVTKDAKFAEQYFGKYIKGHEIVDYKALLAYGGLELQAADKDSAWIGAARFSSRDGKLIINSETRIGSPLYKAGLDRQDILLKIDGESVENRDSLTVLLRTHNPGDTLEVEFEQNGVEKTVDLILAGNQTLTAVPFEHLGQPITQEIKDFRESWLGQKSDFDQGTLQRYCPKCTRAFAFEFDYCRYDGEALNVIKADKQPSDGS